jgi:VWFA-related protein
MAQARPILKAGGNRPSWPNALAAGLTLVLALPGPARPQAAAKASETPVFETGTAAVLLDVVIRDRKGRPATDIQPEEIEVLEDGVKQTIEGFRWVQTEAPQVEGVPAAAARPDPTRQLNLLSLVFDQLGPEARRLAGRAATSVLERGLRPNTFMAVFQIDQRLALLQPFTNDAAKLRAAIDGATAGTYKGITDEQAAMAQAQEELNRTLGQAPEEGSGEGAPASGGSYAARAQAQALSNMLRLSNTLQRQQLGTTSLYPLLALVRGHETLAGRKSLVYLSEGLQVPPNLEQVFRSTISAANRANVSVYAIDARGLNAETDLGASKGALDDARRLSQRAMESRGAGAVSKDEIFVHDTAESALRLNVKGTLADLAESTGGFLVANTNDFKKGAEQLASDLSGYYELSYTPPPAPYDGRFRAIEVKVARKGTQVQARSGYFALPPGHSSAMFAYEVPLLGALRMDPAPKDFGMRAAALHFEDTPVGRAHQLIVEVPIADLKMVQDEASRSYKVHFSVLAVVKDNEGAIVERFSEDYPFTGPLEKAEGLKLGNIVLKRRFLLRPGEYTLEVAGQDRELGKTSVSRASFEVPASGGGPRMSSLALIRRVDPMTSTAEKSDDPLDVGGARVVPNLDAPISAAINQKLSLFFIAYPPPGGEKPRMSLEFWKDGRALARAQPALPAPEADGRIRYVGTFPISSFSPGHYEVRVALQGAGGSCEERSGFTIVP